MKWQISEISGVPTEKEKDDFAKRVGNFVLFSKDNDWAPEVGEVVLFTNENYEKPCLLELVRLE